MRGRRHHNGVTPTQQLDRKDPRVAVIGPTLLKPLKIKVGHESDTVVIELGGQTLRVHYYDALNLAQLIRGHASLAKVQSGDRSKHWTQFAVLTDAEENDKKNIR